MFLQDSQMVAAAAREGGLPCSSSSSSWQCRDVGRRRRSVVPPLAHSRPESRFRRPSPVRHRARRILPPPPNRRRSAWAAETRWPRRESYAPCLSPDTARVAIERYLRATHRHTHTQVTRHLRWTVPLFSAFFRSGTVLRTVSLLGVLSAGSRRRPARALLRGITTGPPGDTCVETRACCLRGVHRPSLREPDDVTSRL